MLQQYRISRFKYNHHNHNAKKIYLLLFTIAIMYTKKDVSIY
jgi:hypothetical protein